MTLNLASTLRPYCTVDKGTKEEVPTLLPVQYLRNMSTIMSRGKNSAATHSIHTPLEDVFPWQDENNETTLICDSVESDGRFVLCTLVSHALRQSQNSSDRNRVLWLCCSSVTDQLTLSALKKIGCNKLATSRAYLPESRSIGQEINEKKATPRLRCLF